MLLQSKIKCFQKDHEKNLLITADKFLKKPMKCFNCQEMKKMEDSS